jgi:hypothetical protein
MRPYYKDRNDYVWGFTNAGQASADENCVHVSLPLVHFWQGVSIHFMIHSNQLNLSQAIENSPCNCITNELSLLFTMMLLHELGHHLMVWWTQGGC